MNTKERIETMIACDRLSYDCGNKLLEFIGNEEIDLKCLLDMYEACRELNDNTKEVYNSVMKEMVDILDSLCVRGSKAKFINEYVKIFLDKFKYIDKKDFRATYQLFSMEKGAINLTDNLNALKVVHIEHSYTITSPNNNRVIELYDKNVSFRLKIRINGEPTDYCLMFIKDRKEEFIGIKDTIDTYKVTDRILKGDYDLCILHLGLLRSSIGLDYDTSKMDNKEFIEFLCYCGYGNKSIRKIDIDDYEEVCKSRLDLKEIIGKLLETTSVRNDVFIKLLASLSRNVDSETLKEITDRLSFILSSIKINDLDNYLDSLADFMDCKKDKGKEIVSLFSNLDKKFVTHVIDKEKALPFKRYDVYVVYKDRIIKMDKNTSGTSTCSGSIICIDKNKKVKILNNKKRIPKNYFILIE